MKSSRWLWTTRWHSRVGAARTPQGRFPFTAQGHDRGSSHPTPTSSRLSCAKHSPVLRLTKGLTIFVGFPTWGKLSQILPMHSPNLFTGNLCLFSPGPALQAGLDCSSLPGALWQHVLGSLSLATLPQGGSSLLIKQRFPLNRLGAHVILSPAHTRLHESLTPKWWAPHLWEENLITRS